MSAPSAIGRFRVVRRLGAGGFATVWLAHDPDLDAPVAVKLLAENWAADADVRRRFTDEARLLRRVDSDHLVRVYDVGELPDGRPYFVMTYADQGNLAERAAAYPPPWPDAEVLRVVDAIAAGLAVLHEHGVVHRDLKPRNVLLRTAPDGPPRVLLGDLGIAKDLHWASGITMPAGSDGYMAPEQRGFSAEIGPATDVHALAVTAAELLGLAGPPWPPTPPGRVVAQATVADPAARTASAPAFAQALRTALTAPPGAAPSGTVPPALPQPVGQLPVPVPPPLPTSAAPRPYPPAPTATGDPTAVARPGDVTRLDAAPGPGGGPLGAGPSVGGPGAGAPGGWSRRRLLVAGGAVVAVALVAALTWNRLTRDEVLTTGDHHARVAVPHGWTDRAALPFPGADDTGAGARASSGARSVSLAYTVGTVGAAQVLARAAPPSGCTPGGVFDTGVGSWKGLDVRWTGCPGGATVDDVVIAGPAGNWTVWLEVTAVGGVPDLPSVVASLDVSP